MSQAIHAPLNAEESRLLRSFLPPNPVDADMDDASLMAWFASLARSRVQAQVQPSNVDPNWALAPPLQDFEAELEAARRQGTLEKWLEEISRPPPRYLPLLQARDQYRRVVESGGWPVVRAGAQSSDLDTLDQRLLAEGYAIERSDNLSKRAASLGLALKQFQGRHGLAVDGKLGPETLAALNVAAEARLAQIELNIERLHWLPATLPADRIVVNVAAAEVTLYRAQNVILRMAAVVGKPSTKTPLFSSQITTVVFNPPWNVPASIARQEILPRANKDPTYLARHHYVFVPGGLQQLPGADNALGQIKFDFPNPFGVYLHDTPSRSAFGRTSRALSHGCVRLEQPRELALQLLTDQGWSGGDIVAAINRSLTLRIAIQRPVPLLVVYETVFIDDAGELAFRPDIYGWDKKLAEAFPASR